MFDVLREVQKSKVCLLRSSTYRFCRCRGASLHAVGASPHRAGVENLQGKREVISLLVHEAMCGSFVYVPEITDHLQDRCNMYQLRYFLSALMSLASFVLFAGCGQLSESPGASVLRGLNPTLMFRCTAVVEVAGVPVAGMTASCAADANDQSCWTEGEGVLIRGPTIPEQGERVSEPVDKSE